LRQHSIFGFEVMPGMGHELRVARMIDGLHADDDLHQFGIMLADVLAQLGLSIGWPGDENCASIGNRLGDGSEEIMIFRGVPAPDRVCLMMYVAGGMIRVQHQSFDVGRAEMEYPCFMVIYPNDGMKVMAVHRAAPLFVFENCHTPSYTAASADGSTAAHADPRNLKIFAGERP
jgi:hypothetical protein